MPIAGYPLKWQVAQQLRALRRERLNPRSEAHAEAIDGQIAVFEAELERRKDEPDGAPPVAAGTGARAFIGAAWTRW